MVRIKASKESHHFLFRSLIPSFLIESPFLFVNPNFVFFCPGHLWRETLRARIRFASKTANGDAKIYFIFFWLEGIDGVESLGLFFFCFFFAFEIKKKGNGIRGRHVLSARRHSAILKGCDGCVCVCVCVCVCLLYFLFASLKSFDFVVRTADVAWAKEKKWTG